jgi:hypothetical protein
MGPKGVPETKNTDWLTMSRKVTSNFETISRNVWSYYMSL